MNFEKCTMCEGYINPHFPNDFEIGEDEEFYCIPCFERESDTGEIY
ncbi:hypothetical protein [Lederbergia galactosidilytica]|nr:hypothetical protein [Lederbergia galactosidilytica]